MIHKYKCGRTGPTHSIAVVLITIHILSACSGGDRGSGNNTKNDTGTVAEHPDVILVLVDALRADHLGIYGYSTRDTSPNIDAIGKESQLFENAVAPAGWTVPSIASLFTGAYPQTHRVLQFIDPKKHGVYSDRINEIVRMDALSTEHDTVAEIFQRNGYQTAALLKSHVVNAGRGFEQGFDHFEIVLDGEKADGESGKFLTDAALRFFEERERWEPRKPLFLYLHYMDVHIPYRPPEPYYSKYVDSRWDSDQDGSYAKYKVFLGSGADRSPRLEPTSDDIEKLVALYDGSIAYFDHQIGRIWKQLLKSGRSKNTIFVLTADHGEAFNEHGRFGHSGVFQEHIHVPLIMRVPSIPARVHADWVETVDLATTLTNVAGLPNELHGRGPDLLTTRHTQGKPDTFVFSEWGKESTIINGSGFKLIETPDERMLYDLNTDPGEKSDISATNEALTKKLAAILEEHLRETSIAADRFPKVDSKGLSSEEVAALKELGYLQ
jgi:arylsulfatase